MSLRKYYLRLSVFICGFMRQRTPKRHITLLEVIVVMVMIGIGAGSVGLYAYRGLQQGRVQSAAEVVSAKLNLAQQISMACDADVTLHLQCCDGVLKIALEGDLPDGYKHVKNGTELKGVDHILWQRRKSDDLELPFRRHYHPRGELVLQGTQEDRTLMLRGYPSISSEDPEFEVPRFPEELFSTARSSSRSFSCYSMCFASSPAPL